MDMYAILNKLESFGLLRQKKQSGNYMAIFCPFHNNGQEKKPSCGVLLESEYRNGKKYPQGLVHCFGCGYSKNLPDAVADMLKLHNITADAREWILENIPEMDEDAALDYERLIPSETLEGLTNRYALDYLQTLTDKKKPYVSEEELASYRYTVPYMYERKLTDEIIEKFDVGFDPKFVPPGRKKPVPCITFPIHDIDGNTLFLCRRSIEGKMYHYPEGTEKPLYGIDMLPTRCKQLFICESIINALTLWSWGYYAVALLGPGNSLQMQQLRMTGADEYVICTDGDEAGHKAAEKLKKVLRKVAITWVVPMPDGKDVNDLTREEFEQCFAARE